MPALIEIQKNTIYSCIKPYVQLKTKEHYLSEIMEMSTNAH